MLIHHNRFQPKLLDLQHQTGVFQKLSIHGADAQPKRWLSLGGRVEGAHSAHKLVLAFAGKNSLRYFCRPLHPQARVAELVDARDSNSRSARSVGSIPTPGT